MVDSREADEGQAIRRRPVLLGCGRRFTTVETAVLAVVKRSGVTEPFSREKVISGVRRALRAAMSTMTPSTCWPSRSKTPSSSGSPEDNL